MLTLVRMQKFGRSRCLSCSLLKGDGIDEVQLHKEHQVVVKPTSTPPLNKTKWEEDIAWEAQQFRLFIASRTSTPPEQLSLRQLNLFTLQFQRLLGEPHLDPSDERLKDDLSFDDIERLGDERYDSDHNWTG